VFGAFLNAAGMTGPVMMWMHQWHARLGSMLSVVTLMYAAGLLLLPAILTALCGWISRLVVRTSWRDAICSFALALVPLGFSMWLAHFSNHLLAGWSTAITAAERFITGTSKFNAAQAWTPAWTPSLELCFLDLGLLFSLYIAWRIACRISNGNRPSLAIMSPWAILAGALYSLGVWIVFQPMQMRGMLMN
jgi:hypothetical protein